MVMSFKLSSVKCILDQGYFDILTFRYAYSRTPTTADEELQFPTFTGQYSPVPGDSRSTSPADATSPKSDSNAKYRSLSVGTGAHSPRSTSPVQLTSSFSKFGRSSFSSGSASDDAMEGLSPRLEIPTFDERRSSGETSLLDPRKSITLTIVNNSAKSSEDEDEQAAKETEGEVPAMETTAPAHPPVKKRNSVTISENVTIIDDNGGRLNGSDTADLDHDDETDGGLDEPLPEDWDPTLPECQELLAGLDEWDFPIFELSSVAGDNILSNVAYRLFMDAGIFETFRLPVKEFINYFRALENGYRDKPYHNRVHAADVLHGVYYMCTQQIPGFTQVSPEDLDPMGLADKEEPDSAFHTPAVTPRASLSSDSSYGILAGNLPALELMALFTAALCTTTTTQEGPTLFSWLRKLHSIHGLMGPVTQPFNYQWLDSINLVFGIAILYNDRSVLENHHAAASWNLFLSKPEYNFLSSLDEAEFRRFRYLVVELILATDLKRHFDFLVEFNAKVNDVDASGINWASEGDRLLVAEMCIKLADISGPTKQKDLHMNWTNRISKEFYDQGDAEAQLGLPISPYMDRNNSQLAKLQEGFINHLVAPLCNAYGSAGLLPGLWLDEEDNDSNADKSDKEDSDGSSISPRREKKDQDKDDEEEDEDDDDDSSSDGASEDSKVRPKSSIPQKTRKMVSILTKHLKENHEMWTNVLKEEEASKASEGDSPTEENVVTSKPMAPIREDSEERTSDTHSMEDDRQDGSSSSLAPASPCTTTDADKGAVAGAEGQSYSKLSLKRNQRKRRKRATRV
ncbi:putative cGMP-inhibited 3',5'-cyclic phosphodiesterase A isoform X 3 [Apostichopus japonicus]|uniref:Putative cGMP-inhibited 3',5'-cyclic phosphodiesterase A isoform X 3 n=1 Tax=Stichopus japonicus TaxID=307972 RepID=A0A2G8LRG5_STIJA|nr:putative cGMP-inhibited 3',5'-cyclic phosphodiesterase A isoform X 3 [Apostichopus japonicus]